MLDVSDFIKRSAERCGYKRSSYVAKNMPTSPSNIVTIPFYGDLRSTCILSSFILRNYKEANPEKYIILCSWPGWQGLFPYVDEYWSLEDESATKTLATEANNFYNGSNLATDLTRSLAEVLNIFTSRDLKKYYDNGFTKQYWDEFGSIRRFLPEVSSASKLSEDFKVQMQRRPGTKVIVYPVLKVRSRQRGETVYLPIMKDVWAALIESLIAENYVPVIYQNWFTYDMSKDFVDRCLYLVPRNVSDVLAAFRYVGCVLDVHSGLSRLALTARCPFLGVTERQSFIEDKDYEIDDLGSDKLPRQYVFNFSSQMMAGGTAEWKINLFDSVCARMQEFLPKIDSAALPTTNESYEVVPYERVRHRKAKRLGCTFINSSKQR
jgi:hypothetical protein